MIKRASKNYIQNLFFKNKNWRILDVGCGYSANEYASIISDIQDLSDFYPNKKFVKLNSNLLPFNDKEFDFVITSHVIEHVENPDHVLLEFKRIIKNKGKIFLFIPNDGSKLWNIVEKFWTIYYSIFIIKKASPSTHLSSFSPQSFFKLVDKVFSNILEFGSLNGGMELYAVCTK